MSEETSVKTIDVNVSRVTKSSLPYYQPLSLADIAALAAYLGAVARSPIAGKARIGGFEVEVRVGFCPECNGMQTIPKGHWRSGEPDRETCRTCDGTGRQK